MPSISEARISISPVSVSSRWTGPVALGSSPSRPPTLAMMMRPLGVHVDAVGGAAGVADTVEGAVGQDFGGGAGLVGEPDAAVARDDDVFGALDALSDALELVEGDGGERHGAASSTVCASGSSGWIRASSPMSRRARSRSWAERATIACPLARSKMWRERISSPSSAKRWATAAKRAGLVGELEEDGVVGDGAETGFGEQGEGVVVVVGGEEEDAELVEGGGVDLFDVDFAAGEDVGDFGEQAGAVVGGDDETVHVAVSG